MAVYDSAAWQDRVLNAYPEASDGERYYSVIDADGNTIHNAVKLTLLNTVLPANVGTPVNAANLNKMLAGVGTLPQYDTYNASSKLKWPFPNDLDYDLSWNHSMNNDLNGRYGAVSWTIYADRANAFTATTGQGDGTSCRYYYTTSQSYNYYARADKQLLPRGAFTIDFSVYVNNYSTSYYGTILDETGAGNGNGFKAATGLWLKVNNNRSVECVFYQSGVILFDVQIGMVGTGWHNYRLTWDGTTFADHVRLYRDGVDVVTATATAARNNRIIASYPTHLFNTAREACTTSGANGLSGQYRIARIHIYHSYKPYGISSTTITQTGFTFADGAKVRLQALKDLYAGTSITFGGRSILLSDTLPAGQWCEAFYDVASNTFRVDSAKEAKYMTAKAQQPIRAGTFVTVDSDGYAVPVNIYETDTVVRSTTPAFSVAPHSPTLIRIYPEEIILVVGWNANSSATFFELIAGKMNDSGTFTWGTCTTSAVSGTWYNSYCHIRIADKNGLPQYMFFFPQQSKIYAVRVTINPDTLAVTLVDTSWVNIGSSLSYSSSTPTVSAAVYCSYPDSNYNFSSAANAPAYMLVVDHYYSNNSYYGSIIAFDAMGNKLTTQQSSSTSVVGGQATNTQYVPIANGFYWMLPIQNAASLYLYKEYHNGNTVYGFNNWTSVGSLSGNYGRDYSKLPIGYYSYVTSNYGSSSYQYTQQVGFGISQQRSHDDDYALYGYNYSSSYWALARHDFSSKHNSAQQNSALQQIQRIPLEMYNAFGSLAYIGAVRFPGVALTDSSDSYTDNGKLFRHHNWGYSESNVSRSGSYLGGSNSGNQCALIYHSYYIYLATNTTTIYYTQMRIGNSFALKDAAAGQTFPVVLNGQFKYTGQVVEYDSPMLHLKESGRDTFILEE